MSNKIFFSYSFKDEEKVDLDELVEQIIGRL